MCVERRLIRIGFSAKVQWILSSKATLFCIKYVLDHKKGILLPLFTHFVNI